MNLYTSIPLMTSVIQNHMMLSWYDINFEFLKKLKLIIASKGLKPSTHVITYILLLNFVKKKGKNTDEENMR